MFYKQHSIVLSPETVVSSGPDKASNSKRWNMTHIKKPFPWYLRAHSMVALNPMTVAGVIA